MTVAGPLRVLMVEDVPEDAELNVAELRRGGLDVEWRRVDTADGLVRELEMFRPRIVLSDYSMPRFDGMAALETCLERAPGIPFIVVTGSRNEETAVQCMKAGASDYVTKGHLRRLVPAVEGALRIQEARTEKEEADERLRLQGAALEAAANGIVVTDRNGVIEWTNPAFNAMTGYSSAELAGDNLHVLKSDFRRQSFYRELWDTILAGRVWRGEFENRRKDGTTYTEEMTITPVRAKGGGIGHFVAVIQDISARKRQEEEVQRLGTIDPLTRLPNRAAFAVLLESAIGRARAGHPTALVLLNLDRFHVVNDAVGHSTGDHLLVQLAEHLGAALEPGEELGRVGGDEFSVIVDDVELDAAKHTAQKLLASIARLRFRVAENVIDLTACAGVAPIDGTLPAETVHARADEALHVAKELGTNRLVAWGAEVEGRPHVTDAMRAAARLRDALKDDRLVIHLQPVVALADSRTRHYEALVRMQEEDGAIVPPGVFLPAAERFGLMPQLDRRVVEKSFELLARRPDVNLFVNLAAASLTDEALLGWIETRVAGLGLAPGRVTFEITETTAVSDLVHVQRWIRRLKELGCGFAIDDFGTGFSSFGYLRSLPVDFVKIDGSFVRDIDTDATSRALVAGMVSVIHALGKEVVAEMVERESVAVVLRALGVEYGQGWLWGRPVPEATLAAP